MSHTFEVGPSDQSKSGDEANSDGENSALGIVDLHFPVPSWTMPVLAVVFAGLFIWAFGSDRVLLPLLALAVLMAAVIVVDLRELRIPNMFLLRAAVLAVPLLAVASTSQLPGLSILRALIAAVVYSVGYFILLLIYPPGLGMGDVKFAGVLGAHIGLFGWIPLGRAILISHVVGGVVSVVVMIGALLLHKENVRKLAIPFGPFMAVGAAVALVIEGLSGPQALA